MTMIPQNKRPKFIESFVPGAIGAGCATVLWPISYYASAATVWTAGVATFGDFWLGAVAIVTGVCAIVGTVIAVLALGFAAHTLAE